MTGSERRSKGRKAEGKGIRKEKKRGKKKSKSCKVHEPH